MCETKSKCFCFPVQVRDELSPAEAERRRFRSLVRSGTTRSHRRGLQNSLYGLQCRMSVFVLERGADLAISETDFGIS